MDSMERVTTKQAAKELNITAVAGCITAQSHKRAKEKGDHCSGHPIQKFVSYLKTYKYYNKSDTGMQEKRRQESLYFQGIRKVLSTL